MAGAHPESSFSSALDDAGGQSAQCVSSAIKQGESAAKSHTPAKAATSRRAKDLRRKRANASITYDSIGEPARVNLTAVKRRRTCLIYWSVLILVILALVKGVFGMPGGRGESPRREEGRALGILKEDYARGDIGKEEFEQKKRDLLA
jgi:putative membrane protein